MTEEYADERRAADHVRRLLDIVACTTRFGKPRNVKVLSPTVTTPGKKNGKSSGKQSNGGGDLVGSGHLVEEASVISDNYDMASIRPTPKLSEFYEFFNFSHLSPPIMSRVSSFFFQFSKFNKNNFV